MSFHRDEETNLLNPSLSNNNPIKVQQKSKKSSDKNNYEEENKTSYKKNKIDSITECENNFNNGQNFFKNEFEYDVNKDGFFIRLLVCLIGITFIGLNSFTNCLVTDEESEGMKDKIIEFLRFYSDFLSNEISNYPKFVTISISVFYDVFIIFGFTLWIFKSKTTKSIFSIFLFFVLMLIMQNLFHIEMPLLKENQVHANKIAMSSIFLNFPIYKHCFYNGQVGFLLLILFEILEHNLHFIFYLGCFYLLNLIAFLMALHHTNTLCVISSLIAALYFDKFSSIYLCKSFNLVDFLKKNMGLIKEVDNNYENHIKTMDYFEDENQNLRFNIEEEGNLSKKNNGMKQEDEKEESENLIFIKSNHDFNSEMKSLKKKNFHDSKFFEERNSFRENYEKENEKNFKTQQDNININENNLFIMINSNPKITPFDRFSRLNKNNEDGFIKN